MAEDLPSTQFHSITDVATASWYAHRTSTPASKQSPSIRHDETRGQTSASSIPAPVPAPVAASGAAASTPSASPIPSSGYPTAGGALASLGSEASSSSTGTSSRRDSEVQASGDTSIRSDITAWQSALQSLPPEFANAPLPQHPLAQVLAGQPTLRPVEWNQYRQQGGFVPRTPHDFSSLMIYISGQVNPNPCRNCLLRNGPFARCVVSPPAVLAVSTLRHACANCTYQTQYKKCTNEPISEQERVRSDLARPVIRAKNPIPRATIPRKPKPNSRTKHQQRSQARKRQRHQLDEPESLSATRSPAGLAYGLGTNLGSFDEKLRHIRACSPRSRRRVAAETLQWQAAIATVEAEAPASTTDAHLPGAVHRDPNNNRVRAPPDNYTPSQPASTSFATFATPSVAEDSFAGDRTTGYDAGPTYEPMDEDESESEQEDEYQGTPWVAANRTGPMIKAPK